MYGRKEVFYRSKYLRKNECTNLWKETYSEHMEILMERNPCRGNEVQKEILVEDRTQTFRRKRAQKKKSTKGWRR